MFKTKYFTSLIKPAFLIWLIPFIISIFFFDREGELAINFWVFKIIMFIVGFATAYLVLKKFYKKNKKFPWFSSSLILLVYNIILDLIVLVGLFGQEMGEYFLTIATVYVIFIPLSNYIVLNSIKDSKTSK